MPLRVLISCELLASPAHTGHAAACTPSLMAVLVAPPSLVLAANLQPATPCLPIAQIVLPGARQSATNTRVTLDDLGDDDLRACVVQRGGLRARFTFQVNPAGWGVNKSWRRENCARMDWIAVCANFC